MYVTENLNDSNLNSLMDRVTILYCIITFDELRIITLMDMPI